MADPYWDPIFATLSGDLELLRQIARDTPDRTYASWAGTHPDLGRKIAPFMRGAKVADRERLVEAVLREATAHEPLRRILFFGWLQANAETMRFTTLPVDDRSLERLQAGEFGSPRKITILSRIDPRQSPRTIYEAFQQSSPSKPGKDEIGSGQTPPLFPPPPLPSSGTIEGQTPDGREQANSDQTTALREENRTLRRRIKDLEQSDRRRDHLLSEKGVELTSLRTLLESEQERNRRLEKQRNDLTQKLSEQALSPHPEPVPAGDPISQHPASNSSRSPDHSPARDSDRPSDRPSDRRNHEDEAEIRDLRQAIKQKEATISRLREEVGTLHTEIRNTAGLSQRIDRLQSALKTAESRYQALQASRFGRVFALNPDKNGNESRMVLEIPGSEPVLLEAARVIDPPLCLGEWVRITTNEAGAGPTVASLETDGKKAVTGFFAPAPKPGNADDFPYLVTESEAWPIHCPTTGFKEGQPLRGFLLGEAVDRPAGVYRLQGLPGGEPTVHRLSIDITGIRRFFRLEEVHVEAFCAVLKRHHIPFTLTAGRFTFDQDIRLVLGRLRMHLPIQRVCHRPECRTAAQTSVQAGIPASSPDWVPAGFHRPPEPDEACDFCGEEPLVPLSQELQVPFSGQSVLIVGGDAVGPRYQEALSKKNLQVEWLSGFGHLGNLEQGLSRFSAIIVVLRQVSHTLLRELLPVAQAQEVPVLFSPNRGVSGLTTLLRKHFGVSPGSGG
jgi:hypothetical protein